jgi:hypothetical protein
MRLLLLVETPFSQLPCGYVVDGKGLVTFFSEGYSIGLGEKF